MTDFHTKDDSPENLYLLHYGVKGMKWGVRRSKVERQAEKDAEEFARAKMFYGEGAGNRRKLIKAKVEAGKKDPKYAKAFDEAMAKQDLGVHANKAEKERGKIDRRTKWKQRSGYLARKFTGEWGTQAAFVAVIATGASFLASPKGRELLNQSMDSAKSFINSRGKSDLDAFLDDIIRKNS